MNYFESKFQLPSCLGKREEGNYRKVGSYSLIESMISASQFPAGNIVLQVIVATREIFLPIEVKKISNGENEKYF